MGGLGGLILSNLRIYLNPYMHIKFDRCPIPLWNLFINAIVFQSRTKSIKCFSIYVHVTQINNYHIQCSQISLSRTRWDCFKTIRTNIREIEGKILLKNHWLGLTNHLKFSITVYSRYKRLRYWSSTVSMTWDTF